MYVEPKSRHACPAFDICTYNGNGRFGSSVPVYRRLATIGGIEPGTDTTWTILGYPNDPNCLKHCRMTAVTGKYLPKESRKEYIAMDTICPLGMSGGP